MANDIVTRLVMQTSGFTGPASEARKVSRETFDSIARDAAAASQRVQAAAEARVRSGGNQGRLLFAVREEARVRAEELRVSREIAAARKAAGIDPTVASGRAMRSEHEQLSRIPDLLRRVAAEEVRTGQSRAAQIERLLRLQTALNARISEQQGVIQRVRESSFIGPMPPPGFRGRGGAGGGAFAYGGIGSSLAHGLQDAVISAQYMGARGSAMAIANNLPMIGEGVGRLGERMVEAGGKAASFGTALARFAGPAGLIASVALPLGAILIPKLMEFGKASDDAKARTDALGESLRRIDEIQLSGRRRPDTGFRSAEELKEREEDVKFQRATAEERLFRIGRVQFRGHELSRETALSKDTLDELHRRIMEADPTVDSSAVDAWHERRVRAGKAPLPEDMLEKARQKEAEILDARLELKQAIEAEAEAIRARAEAEKREGLVGAVSPVLGRLVDSAGAWWRSIEDAKDRQDDLKKAEDRIRALADPKAAEVAELAEDMKARREAIRAAFPGGGARAAALLAMADQGEAAERRRINERFAKKDQGVQLPDAVGRLNAMDAISKVLAGRDKTTEEVAANTKETADKSGEIVTKLEDLLAALKEAPLVRAMRL